MNPCVARCALVLALLLASAGTLLAHSPMFTCFDDGSGRIQCEGAFSDGSSAAGSAIEVRDAAGRNLLSGKLDADGEFSFERPAGAYLILFDGGPGHQVELPSGEVPKW